MNLFYKWKKVSLNTNDLINCLENDSKTLIVILTKNKILVTPILNNVEPTDPLIPRVYFEPKTVSVEQTDAKVDLISMPKQNLKIVEHENKCNTTHVNATQFRSGLSKLESTKSEKWQNVIQAHADIEFANISDIFFSPESRSFYFCLFISFFDQTNQTLVFNYHDFLYSLQPTFLVTDTSAQFNKGFNYFSVQSLNSSFMNKNLYSNVSIDQLMQSTVYSQNVKFFYHKMYSANQNDSNELYFMCHTINDVFLFSCLSNLIDVSSGINGCNNVLIKGFELSSLSYYTSYSFKDLLFDIYSVNGILTIFVLTASMNLLVIKFENQSNKWKLDFSTQLRLKLLPIIIRLLHFNSIDKTLGFFITYTGVFLFPLYDCSFSEIENFDCLADDFVTFDVSTLNIKLIKELLTVEVFSCNQKYFVELNVEKLTCLVYQKWQGASHKLTIIKESKIFDNDLSKISPTINLAKKTYLTSDCLVHAVNSTLVEIDIKTFSNRNNIVQSLIDVLTLYYNKLTKFSETSYVYFENINAIKRNIGFHYFHPKYWKNINFESEVCNHKLFLSLFKLLFDKEDIQDLLDVFTNCINVIEEKNNDLLFTFYILLLGYWINYELINTAESDELENIYKFVYQIVRNCKKTDKEFSSKLLVIEFENYLSYLIDDYIYQFYEKHYCK